MREGVLAVQECCSVALLAAVFISPDAYAAFVCCRLCENYCRYCHRFLLAYALSPIARERGFDGLCNTRARELAFYGLPLLRPLLAGTGTALSGCDTGRRRATPVSSTCPAPLTCSIVVFSSYQLLCLCGFSGMGNTHPAIMWWEIIIELFYG